MAEYIEREALLKLARPVEMGAYSEQDVVTVKNIKNAPTADVVEVRHGKWVGGINTRLNLPQLSAYDDWHCSECGNVYPEIYIGRFGNYCPYCGAKMDGKGEGE